MENVANLTFLRPLDDRSASVLTPEACNFLAGLFRNFGPRREELLARRAVRQREIVGGALPDFLPETAHVRAGSWRVPPPPPDLLDRRVEITGPVDRKMVINALNSGAQCFMADFEDATSPTWENLIDGQINVRDAVRRTISFTNPDGKVYTLAERTATLIVRPRGWHLPEKHVLFEGEPVSGSLFDWGLFFFHNARELVSRGSGPYCYLPKMESHLEARLWHDVFCHAEDALGLPRGTVRSTVLIETILAAFETEEILYELGEHALGLNCGRWDYLFSCIKKLCHRGELYPDRAQLTMTVPFMRAYCLAVIEVCHRRGAYAMGGMAAQIPIKGDPAANEAALAKVRADKEREAADGFDGTWVAHPALVPIAIEAFARHMTGPNQLERLRSDVKVTREALLAVPEGTITEAGVRTNLSVGVQYVEAWLGGLGCVPLYHLMEDAATSEISRCQLWQWLHFGATLADGRKVTAELYDRLLAEEMARVAAELGAKRFAGGCFPQAIELFMGLVKAEELAEFLTLPAYDLLP
ncbi:MAG TPA: malate synthase A [Thermoanaerobaculia bacterium]|nr:malate synthase A [Thermoanaerobaculia bacterium]